jgi:hypothetical protein
MVVGKYPVVDSASEASAGIRGAVPVALWTRPVEQARASCGRDERQHGAAVARGGAVEGDDLGNRVNGGRGADSVWSRRGGRCERRGEGVGHGQGAGSAQDREQRRLAEGGRKERREGKKENRKEKGKIRKKKIRRKGKGKEGKRKRV